MESIIVMIVLFAISFYATYLHYRVRKQAELLKQLNEKVINSQSSFNKFL